MNRICLLGRLTADPELRTTSTGKQVCLFSLAVRRSFQTEGGTSVDFFNLESWGKSGETIAKYTKKGSQLAVTGSLEFRTYEKDGAKHFTHSVRVSDFTLISGENSSASGASKNEAYGAKEMSATQIAMSKLEEIKDDDNDLPF